MNGEEQIAPLKQLILCPVCRSEPVVMKTDTVWGGIRIYCNRCKYHFIADSEDQWNERVQNLKWQDWKEMIR